MNLADFWWVDTDGDGIGNTGLLDADGNGWYDTAALDSEGDGYVEGYAHDTDGDGVFDHITADTDLDGVLDAEGWDVDADGVVDRVAGPDTGGQVVDVGQPVDVDSIIPSVVTIGPPTNPDPSLGLVEMASRSNDPWAWGQVMDILDSQEVTTGTWTLPDGWYYDRNSW